MAHKTPTVPADREGVARALRVLENGGLVALPTETVYGLAARADDAEAVARLFSAKGRPSFNPLIVHVASLEQAAAFTDIERRVADWRSPHGEISLGEFATEAWGRSATLVVPLRLGAPVAREVTAGLDTIGLRLPNHPVARAVIAGAGPLAAPSANRSGFTSPTTADHVLATLDGRIDLVLDAGPTAAGVESTILKLRDDGRWAILRAGPAFNEAGAPQFLAPSAEKSRQTTIEAPGQLARHYSPGKPVRLNAHAREDGEYLIGFGAVTGDATLSATGDVVEAARNLYARLHEAARSDNPRIAVAPVPEQGVGIAINDRLRRAATP
ncbi:L-threonylcarbamoyladenylate synthase [Aurantiacibacter spongiae]|uniref:Threonylcarbamoyl-AMP synthase n=1 Tax=Aurantiacibacter spongiae TaxID=2488860 RepID=A0A3N5DQD5_9SPHN|nr:L-threonylcarbamoyladenylate synthase [Aurantiacibacter spongiae]RPF71381.1 L-threonylcarbamoyladenylate synthase [Aurantiacibacter spongiae]